MINLSLLAEGVEYSTMSIRAFRNQLCSGTRRCATSPSFSDFYHDILSLIAGEIFFEDKLDLLSSYLVNKRCYLACVPWIYRDLTIHMNDTQSLTLLKRLSGRANIARFVRRLTIIPHGRIHWENYRHLTESAVKFTGLQNLRIAANGTLAFDFLQNVELPHMRIELHRGSLLTGSANARLPRQNLLTCSFAGQLTWLEVVIKRDILYSGFKRDFIIALQRCLALNMLRIFDHDDIEGDDAAEEVEEELLTAPFPRLHTFYLSTWSEVLNGRDLWLLGHRGAWAYLRSLTVYTPYHLRGFLTHAVRLNRLHVAVQFAEDLGSQQLGFWLEQRRNITILPSLQELCYSHRLNVIGASPQYVLPWCLLQRVKSTLTEFHLQNNQYSSGDHGVITPTAADILKLRAMCPRLRGLTLDIQWELPSWPKEVLDVLRSWKGFRYTRLIVQKPPRQSINDSQRYRLGVPMMSEAAQTLAFDYISNNRGNVIVEFAQWIDGPSVEVKPYQHTHAFCRDDLGSIRHTEDCPRCKEDKAMDLDWKNKNYAACSDAGLTFLKVCHEHACKKLWGTIDDTNAQALQTITAELQRRERNAKLEELHGDNSAMLYEHLK